MMPLSSALHLFFPTINATVILGSEIKSEEILRSQRSYIYKNNKRRTSDSFISHFDSPYMKTRTPIKRITIENPRVKKIAMEYFGKHIQGQSFVQFLSRANIKVAS